MNFFLPCDYSRLSSEKFWAGPVFLWPHDNIFLLLRVWEVGQEQSSANRTAFGMRRCRNCLHVHLQDLTLSSICPVLASSISSCTAASNFWNNPAEWELLYSTGGGRSLLLQVTWAWASPETEAGYWKEHENLALIELLKNVFTVTRSEQVRLQWFFLNQSLLLPIWPYLTCVPHTTEHSTHSQYRSRPIGCSSCCQRGHPFYISLTKVSL